MFINDKKLYLNVNKMVKNLNKQSTKTRLSYFKNDLTSDLIEDLNNMEILLFLFNNQLCDEWLVYITPTGRVLNSKYLKLFINDLKLELKRRGEI